MNDMLYSIYPYALMRILNIRSTKKIDVVVDAPPPVTDRYTHDSKLSSLISC